MKRFTVALLAALFASSASAGITYEFKTTSSGMSANAMSGIVKSDAGKRRIEITGSTDEMLFPAGSVILANGSTLTVFNPAKKTYYDFDIDKYLQQTAGLGSRSPYLKLDFANPHASVGEDEANDTIAGYPAHRETVDTSFDVTPTIPGLGRQMNVSVKSTTEIWLTDKLPADAANVLQTSRLHTGVPAIDKIVDAMHFKGFPLKQVTTTNVSMNGGDPMTTTSTTVVSNIRTDAKIAAPEFALPAGYTRVEDPLKSMLKSYGVD